MSNSTIYNLRFYPKELRKVNTEDYNIIFKGLFESTKWSYKMGKLISYSIPLIFEIDENKEFIELLIEPYKNYNFLMNLDELVDLKTFDIWTRCMSDDSFIDYFYLYGQNNGGICKYKYEKIRFYTNDVFIVSDLHPLISNGTASSILEYKEEGFYHSGMCIGANCMESYDFDSKLSLKYKCNIEKGKYGKYLDCSGWYSDDKVFSLMKSIAYVKGINKIEFFYDDRPTRIFDNADMVDCYMIDDWENLYNEEFLLYLNSRKNISS